MLEVSVREVGSVRRGRESQRVQSRKKFDINMGFFMRQRDLEAREGLLSGAYRSGGRTHLTIIIFFDIIYYKINKNFHWSEVRNLSIRTFITGERSVDNYEMFVLWKRII